MSDFEGYKYQFKPYNEDLLILFQKEKKRLEKELKSCEIHHIGSTAMGIGGKGILDILVACSAEKEKEVISLLEKLHYLFRRDVSTNQRKFLIRTHPMFPIGVCHLHLVEISSEVFNDLIFFKDYLLAHPNLLKEYETLKKMSSQKLEYRKNKEPFIQKILSLRKKS